MQKEFWNELIYIAFSRSHDFSRKYCQFKNYYFPIQFPYHPNTLQY